jgi:hypothetical protein
MLLMSLYDPSANMAMANTAEELGRRYEITREQAEAHLRLDVVEGISLAWGLPQWTRAVQRLPQAVAQAALVAFDRLARVFPAVADVVVLAGRPRRSATTSA